MPERNNFLDTPTVGNRVAEIPRSDSSKLCFLAFYSIANTPTKKKSKHKIPLCPPLFWYLPWKSKLCRICYSFFATEGSTLEANSSTSVRFFFQHIYSHSKGFLVSFQWCTWKICQFSNFLVVDENVKKCAKKYWFSNFLGPALKKSTYLQAENTLKVISKDPSFQRKKNWSRLEPPSWDIQFWNFIVMGNFPIFPIQKLLFFAFLPVFT